MQDNVSAVYQTPPKHREAAEGSGDVEGRAPRTLVLRDTYGAREGTGHAEGDSKKQGTSAKAGRLLVVVQFCLEVEWSLTKCQAG